MFSVSKSTFAYARLTRLSFKMEITHITIIGEPANNTAIVALVLNLRYLSIIEIETSILFKILFAAFALLSLTSTGFSGFILSITS